MMKIFFKHSDKTNKGFTLIELLVVIAIIGILSSVVLASLNSARKKGRDAHRVSDLRQIRTALELYYDTNGYYPLYSGGQPGSPACSGRWALKHPSYISCWNDLAAKLLPYLSKLSNDPLGGYPPTYTYNEYNYRSFNGQDYCLLMYPELLPRVGEGCYPGWYCVGTRQCNNY